MTRKPARRRVQTRYVRRIAARAIADRLGVGAAGTIIDCDRDPQDTRAVILHVNSGGNALTAEYALRNDGYGVDPVPYFGYGMQLRIFAPDHWLAKRPEPVDVGRHG